MFGFLLLLANSRPKLQAEFNIDRSLCTPNPSAQAVELYDFLRSSFGKKTNSRMMTLQGSVSNEFRETDWVHDQTGKYPALVGLDFMHQVGKGTDWYANDNTLKNMVVNDAEAYYKRGGIPALCWHWRDPSKQTDAFYSPSSGNTATNFDAAKIANTFTQKYKNVMSDLVVIGDQLTVLKNRGVPVLWRPFHEASGKWFWWGYASADALKKLWKIEFDYFTKERGLNNLIWV
jgi:mannan endo-1,4-beta-mannosidase